MPADLAIRFGTPELQRSLGTKDAGEARRKCLAATTWFRNLVDDLRADRTITRADFERIAQRYFASRQREVDRREIPDDGRGDEQLVIQLELTRQRIAELDYELQLNQFSPTTVALGNRLARGLGVVAGQLDESLTILSRQLAARADRQQLRYLENQLTTPHALFVPDDVVFARDANPSPLVSAPQEDFNLQPAQGPTLREAANQFVALKVDLDRGPSHVAELERVMGWLQEAFDPSREISSISRAELREFRNDLGRLSLGHRGQRLPFKERLTDDRSERLKSQTTQRYWRSVQMLCSWAHDEFGIPDLSVGLRLEARTGDDVATPEAFSLDEVRTLLTSPLFVGSGGPRHWSEEGDFVARGGHWWAGLLALFTGMRAGELNQLLPTDFHFDGPTPYLSISALDADGTVKKKVKNKSSIRDVPIHPDLLKLGLRQFVERRQETYPGDRVFREFLLGTAGRSGEGLTRFWAKYFVPIGLKKPGRATHVFRHTVVAILRLRGALEEDIQAVIGHRRNTVTAGYGGAYPLSRKAATVGKIDFGFDVVEAVGGPFDKHRHGI